MKSFQEFAKTLPLDAIIYTDFMEHQTVEHIIITESEYNSIVEKCTYDLDDANLMLDSIALLTESLYDSPKSLLVHLTEFAKQRRGLNKLKG